MIISSIRSSHCVFSGGPYALPKVCFLHSHSSEKTLNFSPSPQLMENVTSKQGHSHRGNRSLGPTNVPVVKLNKVWMPSVCPVCLQYVEDLREGGTLQKMLIRASCWFFFKFSVRPRTRARQSRYNSHSGHLPLSSMLLIYHDVYSCILKSSV